jgi:hypothetical protein
MPKQERNTIMKQQCIISRTLVTRAVIPVIVVAVLLSAATFVALAGKGNAGNPRILPPHAKSHGQSYGDWAAAWWQWVLGIPADINPLTDTTGEFCDESQSGPVWFLAGTFGTSAERSCTVPAGKAIFVPVFNWIFGAGVFDCDPTVPGVECDIEALRAAAAANTEAAEILEVTIDGVPVQNLREYRAASPEPFPLIYPENSVVGVPAGTYFPQVTDGYWLMLAPLPVGEHEIRVYVKAPDTIVGLIEFTVIHHLTVAPGNNN